MTNTILQTETFRRWLAALKDARAKAAILVRIDRAHLGNLGDCEPVVEGVSEMKIDVGPGYRVYFLKRGKTIYLLLCGGSKRTQRRDIGRALVMARELRGK